MFRRVVGAAGITLAIFHDWLLVGQLVDGRLGEPARLLRWLLAACLTAGLVALFRAGAPLLWGRKAMALWLLAAMLHGPATTALATPLGEPALTPTSSALLQSVADVIGLGLLLLTVGLRSTSRTVLMRQVAAALMGAPTPPMHRGFTLAWCARPPPAA